MFISMALRCTKVTTAELSGKTLECMKATCEMLGEYCTASGIKVPYAKSASMF